MSSKTRYRDAASIHVDLPPDRVSRLLADADLLRVFDERLADSNVEIQRSASTVEVRDPEGHVRVGFRFKPEDEGTRIAALEDVRPEGAIEATKHMLFPGRTHEAFEQELKRLRVLLEAIDEGRQALGDD